MVYSWELPSESNLFHGLVSSKNRWIPFCIILLTIYMQATSNWLVGNSVKLPCCRFCGNYFWGICLSSIMTFFFFFFFWGICLSSIMTYWFCFCFFFAVHFCDLFGYFFHFPVWLQFALFFTFWFSHFYAFSQFDFLRVFCFLLGCFVHYFSKLFSLLIQFVNQYVLLSVYFVRFSLCVINSTASFIAVDRYRFIFSIGLYNYTCISVCNVHAKRFFNTENQN